ncbi:glycoside hydrolase family 10 protein [Paenibacillus spongiae]|uniref:Family 10 glycosylhydrolase n=1 Tax=Paenibacillus spongiae TaxID=2909671 RepID=A0ABY5SDI3_9BACL|nr:family 10 glycosylhydrolase [Paenibacillus spongiae]UVI31819.1 family 10 glycosylhydrolase [Paenibacillus spongiae]
MKRSFSFIMCFMLLLSGTITYVYGEQTDPPPDAASSNLITATAPGGSTLTITAVNRPIQAVNEVILYTRDNSSPITDSNEWSTAAVADYVDGSYVVTAIKDKEGAVNIPRNGFVLFANNDSGQWVLSNLQAGDTVTISGYELPMPVTGQLLRLEDGTEVAVDAMDAERQTNQTAVYTTRYGSFTKPFGADTVEFIISGGVVVVVNTNGQAGTYIPTTGYVVSASGTAVEALAGLNVGQSVQSFNLDIPILPASYAKVKGTAVGIDKINGGRGLAEVVLYQPSYGSSTRANAWGMEITVADNVVTRVVAIAADASGNFIDNNSPIPANGYVLSIQSASPYYNELNGKVAVGDSVELVLDTLAYRAGKIGYDALNPRTREDNPGGWHDPTNTPYPGLRGPDQLIIYDGSYGERTGTNPWGNEVVVNANGKVISNGGNDNVIPEGGFVVSGVGTTAAWLSNNVWIGSTVTLNQASKQVVFIYTPESYADKAEIAIAQAEQGLSDSRSRFLDVPYAQIEQKLANVREALVQVRSKLASGSYDGLIELLNTLDRDVTDANFMNFESRKVETRGLWLRPKETNIEQVREHMQKIKAANINSIYLETWWDGHTAFPIASPDTALNPIHQGFDVLQAYVAEGKKLGIEIHAWVENFYVGQNHVSPVYVNHPDWTMVSKQGDLYDDINGEKFYFINPALPEAQEFVLNIYKELVRKYDVDGIHLDFARYPDSGDYTNDFSYDTYTRSLFQNQYGVDPIGINPGDPLWETWTKFRSGIIDSFVGRIVEEVMPIRPGMKLTAAVWPNYEEAPQKVLQDTKAWLDKGYIDHLFHMSYVPDPSLIVIDAQHSLQLADGRAFVSSGVGTFINLTKSVLAEQIDKVNETGVSGTALFEFESLFNNGYDRELKLGLYRTEAIMPDYVTSKPFVTILKEMKRKIDDVYLPLGGMDRNTAKKLKEEIEDAADKTKDDRKFSRGSAKQAGKRLDKLENSIQQSIEVQPEVKRRMYADIAYARNILDIFNSKLK